MLREYIVSLNRNVDYDEFWDKVENLCDTDSFVPERRVDIVNNRDGSLRSCHYALSDEEANKLRHDPNVYSVEIPAPNRDDIQIGIKGVQRGVFTKTNSSSGNFVNWGLKRANFSTNPYGTGFTTTDNYDYILDGTGVDVVIQDSGLETHHPEFFDEAGVSRVQQINWYTESGLAGTQSANHYRDFDGHGTHVAGIVAGRTFGWAKNSRIYSLKVRGLEGAGDSNTGIAIVDCFDAIKLWHRNKPIEAATGKKRPTIVNASWGFFLNYSTVASITYRGTTYSDSNTINDPGYRWTNYGLVPLFDGTFFYTNVRLGQVDVDVQELIDEGIHLVGAAGNQSHKIDIDGGADYDNYLTTNGNSYFYHRGSSPYDEKSIVVGSLDSSVISADTEQKVTSSETGPGVDLYAPGANVVSACSNINSFGNVSYSLNASFRQINIGGTSMASPQVCGMSALYLQMNPGVGPDQLKKWIINTAMVSNLLYTTTDTDYTNIRSLLGGNNKMLYNPFGIPQDGNLSGGIVLNNAAFTLIK